MNISDVKGKEQGDAIRGLEATVTRIYDQLMKNEDGSTVCVAWISDDTERDFPLKWGDSGGQMLRKGDRIRIEARPGSKGTKLQGAFLGWYTPKGKDKSDGYAQIIVYGDKLEILGREDAPKSKQEAATRAQAPGKSHSFRTMTESQARLFIWRQMNEFAKLCNFDFGELSELPEGYFQPIKEVANTMFIAWQKGEITPDQPEDPALEFPPKDVVAEAKERIGQIFGPPDPPDGREKDPYAV